MERKKVLRNEKSVKVHIHFALIKSWFNVDHFIRNLVKRGREWATVKLAICNRINNECAKRIASIIKLKQ